MKVALFLNVGGVVTEGAINLEVARLLGVEREVQEIETKFRMNEISNDEFNRRLIPLFKSKRLTQSFVRDNFRNFRTRTYYEELIKLTEDVFLLSSGPSYFIDILAEKLSIPPDRVLCSKYEFDQSGLIESCSRPVSSVKKADWVKEKARNFDLTIGIGDNPEQDSAFLSQCDIRILMEEFRIGYISVREIEPLLHLIESLTGIYKLVGKSTELERIIDLIFNRFHLVARNLRKRHEDRSTLTISDEYDVQDLLYSLLNLYFEDIRREEWTPSYAGGSSRMDFLLKDSKAVIEVKKTRKSLSDKEIGEQLIVDIERYQSHPDCDSLFCFVYNPEGLIANPRGLEKDLNKYSSDDFRVKVYVQP